jgi:putative membrane protein
MNHALALANAIATSISLVCMLAGRRAIARRDVTRHKRLMIAATLGGTLFVVLFVIRFVSFGFTQFQGHGVARGIYTAVLFSHEPLAVVNVPLVIVALGLGLRGSHPTHKEIARYALPIWIYVAATGIVIYLFAYFAPFASLL